MLTKTSGIFIPNNDNNINNIKKELTRQISDFDDTIYNVEFFETFSSGILIPRYFPITDEILDKSEFGLDIEIELNSNISLRNTQIPAVDYIINNYTGVIQMDTGIGKTFTSIYSIAKIKKKTIIFAHKVKLLEQWENEFYKITNLTKDDIGYLSTKNYEKILEKKIILCTPHIISIAKKKNNVLFLNALNIAKIGIMFIDEVHCGIGAEEFSKSSLEMNCKRTYGLSATPKRYDGNTDIIHFHLGELKIFESNIGEILDPTIYISKFDFNVHRKHRKYINWGGKFNLSRYCQQLIHSDEYCLKIVKVIKKLYDSKRKVLILGSTEKLLLHILKISNIKKEDVGIFIGKTKEKDKLKYSDNSDLDVAFKTKQMVFATYSIARDGSNRPDLDALVMLNPTTNIIQAIGRIRRSDINKKQPVVFDFVDIDPTILKVWDISKTKKVQKFEKAFQTRLQIYEDYKWKINYVNIKT